MLEVNVPSFIVTLGGMFVLNGAILLVTQGKTIPANQPSTEGKIMMEE